ncbi:MAG: phosphatase PAP2 family protein [Candidatus Rhabdochlamydia sp.]
MGMHQFELGWIQELQNVLRNTAMDSFFICWNYIDTTWFLIIFVSTIMCLFSRKEGIRLLFLFIFSGVLNIFLKNYFHLPRPCHLDPSIGIFYYKSFGFPSGAAQTATLIIGIAFAKCRQNIYKIFAALFAFFLYFSRIYLGVHFFTDICGGILAGISLLVIYLKVFPLIENHWGKIAFGLSALFFILGGVKMLPQAAMMLGIAIGLLLVKHNESVIFSCNRIVMLLVVTIGSSSLFYLGKVNLSLKSLATFFAGFWFIYLGGFLTEKFSRIYFKLRMNARHLK